jgi:hypothetical protein
MAPARIEWKAGTGTMHRSYGLFEEPSRWVRAKILLSLFSSSLLAFLILGCEGMVHSDFDDNGRKAAAARGVHGLIKIILDEYRIDMPAQYLQARQFSS